MRNEGPRDAEHPRISSERSVGQLRQLPIVAGRQIVTNFADLLFDKVVIVKQPLGGRRHRVPLAGRASDGAVCFEENRLVVLQPHREGSAGHRPRGRLLGRGKALGMLLQTFDAEKFLVDGIFSLPRGSGWTSSEGAKDRRYQVGLSAADARILSRALRLVSARCRNCGAAARLDYASRKSAPSQEAADLITNHPGARQSTAKLP